MPTGFESISRDPQLQDHWMRRLVAFIIDSFVVSVFTFVIITFVMTLLILLSISGGMPWNLINLLSFPLFTGILSVLYFALFESYYASTLGKRLMKLKTVDITGEKPKLDLAFLRNISKIYWILVLLDTVVGLATPGDPHQRISDRVAETIVKETGGSPFRKLTLSEDVGRFCPHCGQALEVKADYCTRCGKKLTS